MSSGDLHHAVAPGLFPVYSHTLGTTPSPFICGFLFFQRNPY